MSRLALPDFDLEVYFSRWEFAAQHNLTASDAETLTVRELLDLSADDEAQALFDMPLSYIPTWGFDRMREAIAATYDSIEAEHVLTFAGAGEALFWGLQLLLDPGDHAIVTVPNYQSLESVPMATGVAIDGLPLWSGRGESLRWQLDLDRLRSLLRPETRLLAVNFPNNPTGFIPPRDSWLELLELCDERRIRVVSDEVYRGVEVDSASRIPQAVDCSPSALSVNVMSKAYGLPGLRVGWVACRDAAVLQRLEKAKHYTSICNAGPSEQLATVALRHAATVLERNRQIVAANSELVRVFADRHDDWFDYRAPDGGCVAFPRYLGPDDVEVFCRRAVEESGVMLLPASLYKSSLAEVPSDRFRIGIGRRAVPQALEALGGHLRRGSAPAT